MRRADVLELLKSGKLFGIGLGASQDAVLEAVSQNLGSPGICDLGGFRVITFEGMEFHLLDDALVNLTVKVAHYGGRSALMLGPCAGKLGRRSSFGRVLRLLEDAGVVWRMFQPRCEGDRVELITEGSATLEFVFDRAAKRMTLNRIHLTEGESYADAC